jgi:peroxiredoxin Q/BCP
MFGLFSKPLPVGSSAPPFIAPDDEGHVFILNLNRNKFVVLIFYPGDDTPVCTRQLCELRDQWGRLQERGAYVVGVNPQSAESHRAFKAKHKLPFPILVDSGQRIARLYRANGLIVKRTVYVIGKNGEILFAKRGKPSVDEILAAIPHETAPQPRETAAMSR